MSREIMIIAKNKDGVVSNNIVKIGENGEHIVIKGTKDTFYEIKDMATNRAPDQIYTKRFKNDLKLKINPKGGALDGMGEADVTIENYCANGNCEIVGVHETGEYYQYVPQSGDKGLMTTNIADGEFAYQSLGTVEAGGFGPLSALPLAGLAGLGGGGGGKKPDTTAPTAVPTIDTINDDVAPVTGIVAKGGHTDDTTPTLNGTITEALGSGEVVAVYRDGVKVGNATVDASGTGWSFTDAGVTDGNHIYTARAEDTAGNKGTESTPYNIIVDTVAPNAPTITMVEDDVDSFEGATYYGAQVDTGSWNINSTTGNINISGNVNVVNGKIITNDSTPTLSGTGEAGTTVKIYDGDPDDPNNLVGTTTVQSNGTWSITTYELQESSYLGADGTDKSPIQNVEHTLNITLIDTAGNVSAPTSIDIIIDTLMTYSLGHLTFTNAEDGNKRFDKIADIKSGDNHYFTGTFTISDDAIAEYGTNEPEDISYQKGDEIFIELGLLDDSGNVVALYRIGGPDGPTTTVGSDGKWSITIDPTKSYYNKMTGAMETLHDGNYTNQVTVRTLSGDEYTHASDKPVGKVYGSFGIDTTAPDASQVVSQTLTNNHTITINVVDSAPMESNSSGYLVGTGVNELLIYRDGVEVGTKNIVGETSLTNWTDDVSLADGVYMYQIDSVDVAGNYSGLGEKTWVLFDSDTNHDLTATDNDSSKHFNEMMLVGDSLGETFTLDNVGFISIDAAGGITDTFVLQGTGLTLDITQTKNFEVYNINDNTLTINGDVNADLDHIIINGTSSAKVDISADWSISASQTEVGYTIYNNTGSDDLWIQTGVSVI